MIRSYGCLLMLSACLLFLGPSCTRESGKVTLMVGGAPAELDYWDKVMGEFSASSGVKVELMRQPTDTDQRRQSLIIPLKAGEHDPDVFLMDIVWIGQFAASGWLERLDPYAARSASDLKVFFPGIIEFADRYQSDLVALPVYVDAGLLYYRTDLLAEYGYQAPPETWEDLIDMAGRIQQGERAGNQDFWGFVWQGAQYEGLVCDFLEFALSEGGSLVDPEGDLTLDAPANVRALELMRGLIATYKVSPPNTYTEMKEEEVRNVFQMGNALFERNWPYAWGLHQAEGSSVKDKVGTALLPKGSGGRHASALGGWHVGMSASSDNKEASWQLIRFIVSRPAQLGFALNLGWNPARQDVYDSPELRDRAPHLVTLKEVFATATPRPNVPYYSLLSRVLQAEVNAALAGVIEPAAALERAEQEGLNTVRTYEQ